MIFTFVDRLLVLNSIHLNILWKGIHLVMFLFSSKYEIQDFKDFMRKSNRESVTNIKEQKWKKLIITAC